MNTNLIQQLANKDICLENKSKDNLENLIKILRITFPKDVYSYDINECFLNKRYFFKSNDNSGNWNASNKTPSLPIIPIEHFFLKIEDVCVKGDKIYGSEMLNIFKNNNVKGTNGVLGIYPTSYYFINEDYNIDYNLVSVKIKKTILTFQQFKQYFQTTKKEETMEKKQIGWKIIKPEYRKMALDICHTSGNWENTLQNYDIDVNQTNYIKRLTEAGVLDLWFEPVYEEVCKNKQFQLNCTGGTFSLTVQKEGLLYAPDNKILSISFIKDIVKNGIGRHKNYEFVMHVSHIDMGCKKAVPVEDIQKCIDYWEENFK